MKKALTISVCLNIFLLLGIALHALVQNSHYVSLMSNARFIGGAADEYFSRHPDAQVVKFTDLVEMAKHDGVIIEHPGRYYPEIISRGNTRILIVESSNGDGVVKTGIGLWRSW